MGSKESEVETGGSPAKFPRLDLENEEDEGCESVQGKDYVDKEVWLFGWNMTPRATLFGYTNEIVKEFHDPSNKLKRPVDLTRPKSDGSSRREDFPSYNYWMTNGLTSFNLRVGLNFMKPMAGETAKIKLAPDKSYRAIVVEKRANFVEIYKEAALVHGYMILADNRGLIGLKLINEGVAAVHRALEIGDEVIFTGGYAHLYNSREAEINSSMANVKGVDLEIRMDAYEFDTIFIANRGVQLPLHLFLVGDPTQINGGFNLFTPTELVKKLHNLEMLNGFDLIGVISSQKKRERSSRYTAAIKFADNQTRALTQFNGIKSLVIQDVDKSEQNSIIVKLFLNFDNLIGAATKFKRGNLILFTNLAGRKFQGGLFHDNLYVPHTFASSNYTRVYVGREIESYISQRPKEYTSHILQNFGHLLNPLPAPPSSGESSIMSQSPPTAPKAPLSPTVSTTPPASSAQPVPNNPAPMSDNSEVQEPSSLSPQLPTRDSQESTQEIHLLIPPDLDIEINMEVETQTII